MNCRIVLSLIGGMVLLSLTACAESLHQNQRVDFLAVAGDYGAADVYSYGGAYYGSPWFWGAPFGYYSGFYGPGYRYPYYGHYRNHSWSGSGGPAFRSAPPMNAPRHFSRRR